MCLLHVQVWAQFGRLRPNKTRETMVLFVASASGRISVFDIEVPPPPLSRRLELLELPLPSLPPSSRKAKTIRTQRPHSEEASATTCHFDHLHQVMIKLILQYLGQRTGTRHVAYLRHTINEYVKSAADDDKLDVHKGY